MKNKTTLFLITLAVFLFFSNQIQSQDNIHEKQEEQINAGIAQLESNRVGFDEFNQRYRHSTLVALKDSMLHWYWDIENEVWEAVPYRRSKDYTYDDNYNQVEYIEQLLIDFIWENQSKYISLRDANDNFISLRSQEWDGNAWVNDRFKEYTYDDNNNRTSYEFSFWDIETNSWKPNSKNTYEYDNNNNRTSYLSQDWDIDINEWVNDNVYHYEYDVNNNETIELKQDWDIDAGDWVSNYRNTSIYDGNILSSLLRENWEEENEEWIDFQFTNYEYQNGLLVSTLREEWETETGEWINDKKTIHEYDEFDNELSNEILEWSTNSSVWNNEMKYTYQYDDNNNELIKRQEIGEDNIWSNLLMFVYTYDLDNNKTSSLLHHWDENEWQEMEKNTFGFDADGFIEQRTYVEYEDGEISYGDSTHYYYQTVNEIDNWNTVNHDILVYPNPFNSNVTIDLGDNHSYYILVVSDANGREIEVIKVHKESLILWNSDGLPNGTYIINVIGEKENKIQKIIKQ